MRLTINRATFLHAAGVLLSGLMYFGAAQKIVPDLAPAAPYVGTAINLLQLLLGRKQQHVNPDGRPADAAYIAPGSRVTRLRGSRADYEDL